MTGEMHVDSRTLKPVFTLEIPVPVVEPGKRDGEAGALPRRLAEIAGHARARRRVLALTVLFAALILLEILLLARLSRSHALHVYPEPALEVLVEP